MSAPVRAVWGDLCAQLDRLGLLDSADGGVLAAYSEQLVRHERCAHLLAEHAHLMLPDEVRMWEQRLRWSGTLIAQHATRLGLTPASRQSMTVEKPYEPGSGRLDPNRLLNP